MKMFELKDVVSLLRDEVQRTGSQEAFAKRTGIHRTERIRFWLVRGYLPAPSSTR